MKYINLIDYVGKPELIQHVDGGLPIAVVGTPGSRYTEGQVGVIYSNGDYKSYTKDGRYFEDSEQVFILRPKPKRVVKGYRKAVLYKSGSIETDPLYRPSKEEFEFESRNRTHTLLGEWQEVEYEIEE